MYLNVKYKTFKSSWPMYFLYNFPIAIYRYTKMLCLNREERWRPYGSSAAVMTLLSAQPAVMLLCFLWTRNMPIYSMSSTQPSTFCPLQGRPLWKTDVWRRQASRAICDKDACNSLIRRNESSDTLTVRFLVQSYVCYTSHPNHSDG